MRNIKKKGCRYHLTTRCISGKKCLNSPELNRYITRKRGMVSMSERVSYKKLYNRLQYLPPCKDGYHWSIDANICGYSLCIVKDAGGGQYYTSSPMKGS